MNIIYDYKKRKKKSITIYYVGKDRLERNKKSAEYLVTKYPDIFSFKYRKNGMLEVRMNKLKKENL
jgi:hypothetical protein